MITALAAADRNVPSATRMAAAGSAFGHGAICPACRRPPLRTDHLLPAGPTGRGTCGPMRAVGPRSAPAHHRPPGPLLAARTDAAASTGPQVGAEHPPGDAALDGEITPDTPHIASAPPITAPSAPAAGSAAGSVSVTAVSTADCSGTVDLDRLAGPHTGQVVLPWQLASAATLGRQEVADCGPWDLARPAHKVHVYQACLSRGSAYDIYRWANLADLAALWSRIPLSGPLRAQWTHALRSRRLLPTASR